MRWSSVTLAVCLLVAACSTRDRDSPNAGSSVPPAPAVPEPRTEVAAGVLGDRLVVLGGLRADGSATDRVDLYDPVDRTWSSAPPLPKPLHHAAAAKFGDRLYVVGGYTTAGDVPWRETADVWSLGTGDASWRSEPPLATPRGALGAAAAGGRLFAFGGTSRGQVIATTEVLVAGTDAWRTAPAMAQAREHLAAVATSDRVYALGGRVGGLETNLAAVESIEPAGFAPSWRREPDLRMARGGTSGAAVGATVCIAGGEEPAATIPTVECLRDGSWREDARLAVPRHGLGVVAWRGHLHVIAGGPRPGLFVSDAHEVVRIG